jgi:glycosyltransferase involved in cell wall biosynthesis
MLHGARIAVIVPAYNEARHIALTLAGMPSFVDDVIVVDDASTDDTAARAEAYADSRVRVVRHEQNRGVGGALKTGYRAAFSAGADAVAVMAGDNQMHADDLPALLAPVLAGEADYAKGDRLSHADARGRMPVARFLGNHVLSFLTRWCTGARVRDSQCGYTVLGRKAALSLPLDGLWEGYGYPNDLIAALARNGFVVRDVVVRPIYADEISGIGWRHALVVIPFLLLRALARRFAWLGLRENAREESQLENVR